MNHAPGVKLECYAGYRVDETPRRCLIGEWEIYVDEIIDRWHDPAYRYFKIRGSDHVIYLIRHGTHDDRWQLTMFNSGSHQDIRLSSP
jgi:hypothetical protein